MTTLKSLLLGNHKLGKPSIRIFNSWTAKNNLNTARYGLSGCGTTSSALSFGGYTGSNSAVTEQWDGT